MTQPAASPNPEAPTPPSPAPAVPAALAQRLAAPGCRVFVLTGAGISAAAGLATYRGADGLYPSGQLIPLDSTLARTKTVHQLWQTLDPLYRQAATLAPTPAHTALAAAQTATGRVSVATQNVDGLHARAGGTAWELHGSLSTARCLNPRCRSREQIADLRARAAANGATIPTRPLDEPLLSELVARVRCECGSRLRPDVVLFNEALDAARYRAAAASAAAADVVIAAGTSLQVFPAADLVVHGLALGATGVWLETDPETMRADLEPHVAAAVRDMVVLPGDVQHTLPALFAQLSPQEDVHRLTEGQS